MLALFGYYVAEFLYVAPETRNIMDSRLPGMSCIKVQDKVDGDVAIAFSLRCRCGADLDVGHLVAEPRRFLSVVLLNREPGTRGGRAHSRLLHKDL